MTSRLREVHIEDLIIASDRRYDRAIDASFVASIRTHGVIQPLVVEPDGTGRYIVLDGRRRLRHARAAGITEIPVVVRGTTDDLDALMIEAESNAHRRDWTPLEIATLARDLIDEHDWTQAAAASWLADLLERSITQPQVSQYLKLLDLTDEAKTAIAAGPLTFTAARALSKLNDEPAMQRALVREIEASADRGQPMSTRAINRRIDQVLTPPELAAEELESDAAARASKAYDAGPESATATAHDLPLDGDAMEASYLQMGREALAYLVERLEAGAEPDPRFTDEYEEVTTLSERLEILFKQNDEDLG